MIAFLALAYAFQAAPPTAPPAPAQTQTIDLAGDPKEIARAQFIAFATNDVDPSLFSQPPDAADVSAARTLLLAIGRMKRIDPLPHTNSLLGIGYAYRFTCEHGTAVERFTLRAGKITSISFTRT